MRRRFIEFLDSMGLSFIEKSPTVISFVYKKRYFLMIYDEVSDSNYIKICLPDVESSTTINENVKTKVIKINSEYKVGKAILVDNQIWLTAESFVYCQLGAKKMYKRMIDLLISMLNEYLNYE